jgi:hypothetical protein
VTTTWWFLLAAATIATNAFLIALVRSRKLGPTYVCRRCHRGFRRPSDALLHVAVAHPKR